MLVGDESPTGSATVSGYRIQAVLHVDSETRTLLYCACVQRGAKQTLLILGS